MASLPFLVKHSRQYQGVSGSEGIVTELLGLPKLRFKVGARVAVIPVRGIGTEALLLAEYLRKKLLARVA